MLLPQRYLIALLIISATMFITVRMKKLMWPASVAGGVIGILVFCGAGLTGIAMMAAFFILGTAATSWKSKSKTSLGIAEAHHGRRAASQVIANAGAAGVIGCWIYFSADFAQVGRVLMAAGFSAATADTLASELGNVYGRRYYNIITFKKDERGLNGVISLEGTLAGIMGSVVIAIIYAVGFGWDINFLLIVVAGTVGNLADSVLGATVERKGYLGNDVVNFLNTCVAVLTAFLLSLVR